MITLVLPKIEETIRIQELEIVDYYSYNELWTGIVWSTLLYNAVWSWTGDSVVAFMITQ